MINFENLVFAKRIEFKSGMESSGLIDVKNNVIFCHCTKETGTLILETFKKAKELELKLEKSITWTIEDFEGRAKQIESNIEEGEDFIYNRDLFPGALEKMIRQHDASIGINWETIDAYLEECKFNHVCWSCKEGFDEIYEINFCPKCLTCIN